MEYQITLGEYQTNYLVQSHMNPSQPMYKKPSLGEEMGFRRTRAS